MISNNRSNTEQETGLHGVNALLCCELTLTFTELKLPTLNNEQERDQKQMSHGNELKNRSRETDIKEVVN